MKTFVAIMQIKPAPTIFLAVFLDQPGMDPRATIGLQHGATAADVVIVEIAELDDATNIAGVKWPLSALAAYVEPHE